MDREGTALSYSSVQRGRARNPRLPSVVLAISSLACSAAFFAAIVLLRDDYFLYGGQSIAPALEASMPVALLLAFALAILARSIANAHLFLSTIAIVASVGALFVNGFAATFLIFSVPRF